MNKQVEEILRAAVVPHRGFEFKVSDAEFGGIDLTVFLDSFAELSTPQREDCAVWIGGLCQKIRDTGTPCFISGAETHTRKGKYAM